MFVTNEAVRVSTKGEDETVYETRQSLKGYPGFGISVVMPGVSTHCQRLRVSSPLPVDLFDAGGPLSDRRVQLARHRVCKQESRDAERLQK